MSPVRTSVKIAGAAGVTAIAAGLGASQALADTSTPTPSGTTSSAPAQGDAGPAGKGGPGGPGTRGHGPDGADAAALAKELGVTEAKLRTALDAVRDANRPARPATPPAQGTKPTPPTAAERTAHEKARVAALAKQLGLSEAKVQAAFDAVRADHEAARRTDLSSRLDGAVKDGKLTAADKASVLKAFDAGVLGGPRP
ncbi:hypothetical protein [Pedococcus soli]